jgi:small-conductance mechanosensitive channel
MDNHKTSPMKTLYRALFVLSLLLIGGTAAAVIFSRYWVSAPLQQKRSAGAQDHSGLVDEQPLETADALAHLSLTSEERDFAQEALRLADHEVDLNFASALRNATQHPAPLSPAAQAISKHIQDLQEQVKAQQQDIDRLKAQLAKAKDSQKQPLDEDLQLQQALLEVSQEELDGAQQELIRAGGDQKSIIQRLQDQHEARHMRENGVVGSSTQNAPAAPDEPEGIASRSVVAQSRYWLTLNAKAGELQSAQQETKVLQAELARQRQEVEKNAQEGAAPSGNAGSTSLFSTLKHVAQQQRDLAELDKRSQDMQSLGALYGNWNALVKSRQKGVAIGLLEAVFWIAAILLVVILVNPILGFVFSGSEAESHRLHTVRVALRFALQMMGLALVLLVILGPPSQIATVVALAGAGLTVALKDFIVGFIGWFALMGPNGISPGDWVEIDGVGGEVQEVGPLHTILLETGGWSDAGHPTGRKVTFVNSFAIEGHYFNFSTSGQWLWDDIQVPIPEGIDPQPVVEAIQKIVVTETDANARQAEQEWLRVVQRKGGRPFSAAPAISVQPTGAGVNVTIRYITRAPEWRDVRARLYGEIVGLLRKDKIPSHPEESGAPKAVGTGDPH